MRWFQREGSIGSEKWRGRGGVSKSIPTEIIRQNTIETHPRSILQLTAKQIKTPNELATNTQGSQQPNSPKHPINQQYRNLKSKLPKSYIKFLPCYFFCLLHSRCLFLCRKVSSSSVAQWPEQPRPSSVQDLNSLPRVLSLFLSLSLSLYLSLVRIVKGERKG